MILLVEIAIIGGTGVYDPSILSSISEKYIDTPYGTVQCKVGTYGGNNVAFIPRHGSKHSIPPHLINYRANIWAMKKIGVKNIIATTAVGSLNVTIPPASFVLVDQFIDFTKSRTGTFYDGGEHGVVHVDMTNPYCQTIKETIIRAAQKENIAVFPKGTYICTEGPRFETPAEIAMFAKLDGDVVGMTNVPEVVLAREAEICYATISMVTNYAAGISKHALTHGEVLAAMKANTEKLKNIIMATVTLLDPKQDCRCQHALAEYGGFKL